MGRHHSRAERAALVAALERSGESQRAFCRRQGLSVDSMRRWRRERESTEFTEVLMAADALPPLEVVTPGGFLVRGTDVGALAALARALS